MAVTQTNGAPLALERRQIPDKTAQIQLGPDTTALFAPIVDEDYWVLRVRLSDHQAIVGFPKLGTVGIGFAQEEEDWNTNLPWRCRTDDIVSHIWKNRGDDAITREMVTEAVRMVQEAAPDFVPEERGMPPLAPMSEIMADENTQVIDLNGQFIDTSEDDDQ